MQEYIIYARKSSESEERQALSIESQVHELQLLAAKRQLPPQLVFTESHSAKAPGQPVFRQVMKLVQARKVRAILCWKLDRLARNHLDTGIVMQALADGLIESVITPERVYTADGTDRFLGAFELGMATKYIDDLRANVKRGNRARFQRGWPNYRPPIGYLEDLATKTVVIDPLRFGLVRRMWDLLLSGGLRPMQIWKIATRDWHLTSPTYGRSGGGLIKTSSLYRLFNNPFYAGRIVVQASGEEYRGAYPAMISEEEFQRAKEILLAGGKPKPHRHIFPYTGLFKCACGLSISAEEHIKKSGRHYVYYKCSHARKFRPCRQPMTPARSLEAQLFHAAAGVSMPPTVHAWLIERLASVVASEGQSLLRARASLEEAWESVQLQLRNLLELRLRGQVDEEQFVLERQRLLSEDLALRERRSQPAALPATTSRLTAADFSRRVLQVLTRGTVLQRRVCILAIWRGRVIAERSLSMAVASPITA